MSQLADLSKPFSSNLVHENPSGGGHYVKHHVVNQRLLLHVGAFDFELVQIIRGHVAGTPPNPNSNSARGKAGTPDLHDAVVGAVCRLRCTIDGNLVTVEEVGDCEQPHNWTTDGARMKDAMSDAFKRCAMRLGLGLHLWSNEEYFLDKQLAKRESAESEPDEASKDIPKVAAPKPPPTGGPVMSDGQQRAIFALLRQLDVGDDTRHEYVAAIVSHPVESFSTLTLAEAGTVIEELQRRADGVKQGTLA